MVEMRAEEWGGVRASSSAALFHNHAESAYSIEICCFLQIQLDKTLYGVG